MEAGVDLLVGDCLTVLPLLEARSFQTCITSPPYWGLRDYGVEGQFGLEATPEEYIERLVEVFRAVRRVLRPDGTLWLNLGDSYSHGGNGGRNPEMWPKQRGNTHRRKATHKKKNTGLKPKDLVGIPWRVALALQADGWWLRSDIIWHKPNPMPESVRDRPTSAHEFLFLLAKSKKYYCDMSAIREPAVMKPQRRSKPHKRRVPGRGKTGQAPDTFSTTSARTDVRKDFATRNKRDVWTISTKPFKKAHFAVMPPDLVRDPIIAGARKGRAVLDPFGGAGTVGLVAAQHGRRATLIELNAEYAALCAEHLEENGVSSRRRRPGDLLAGPWNRGLGLDT